MGRWLQDNWIVVAGVVVLVSIAAFSLRNLPASASKPSTTHPTPGGKEDRSTQIKIYRMVEHANEADFARLVLQSDVPVLVDFYADWCGPCRTLAPVLEEVARETPHAKVVKVNVDQNPQLAARYGISSIPSVIVFKQGKVATRHTGLASKSQLKTMLD